jgi:hypothetical protein
VTVTLQVPFAHLKAAAHVAKALKTAGNGSKDTRLGRELLGVHVRASDTDVEVLATDGRLLFRARSPRAEPNAPLPRMIGFPLLLDAAPLCVDLQGAPKTHGPHVFISDTDFEVRKAPCVHMSSLRGEWDAPGRMMTRGWPDVDRLIDSVTRHMQSAERGVFDPALVALAHEAISLVHQPLGPKVNSLVRMALHRDDAAGRVRTNLVLYADSLGGFPHHGPKASPVVVVVSGALE